MSCYGKDGKAYGKVTDDKGKPLSDCVVRIDNSEFSTHTDQHGEFSIAYNTDSSHSLTVLFPGFEPQEIKIGDEALWVILKHKINELKDVVVAADYSNGKIKEGVLGKKNLKPYGLGFEKAGNEAAVFLYGDAARHGILKEVFFYITKEGIPGSRFKVHIYGKNAAHLPGDDLLDSNVVLHATTGGEWVSADLSSRHIPVDSGLFISMQWLSGRDNLPNLVTGNKKDKEHLPYDAQVVSYTKSYTTKEAAYYHYSKNFGWNYSGIYDERHHKKSPVPMIYATYTYSSK